MKKQDRRVVTVRSADWVSTTARWGVGILLGGFFVFLILRTLFGEPI